MTAFRWTGRTAAGQQISGTTEAPAKEVALLALKLQNITITSIEAAPARTAFLTRILRIIFGRDDEPRERTDFR